MPIELSRFKNNPTTQYIVEFLENPVSLSQFERYFRYDLLNCMKQALVVTITTTGKTPNPYTVKLQKEVLQLKEELRLPFLTLVLWYSVSTILLSDLFSNENGYNRVHDYRYNCDWFQRFMNDIHMEPYIQNEDYVDLVYNSLDTISRLHIAETDEEPDEVETNFLFNLYSKLLQIALLHRIRVVKFTKQIHEELMSVALSPDRISNLIETYGMDVLEWGI